MVWPLAVLRYNTARATIQSAEAAICAGHCTQGHARACCNAAGLGHDTTGPRLRYGATACHDTAQCSQLGRAGWVGCALGAPN